MVNCEVPGSWADSTRNVCEICDRGSLLHRLLLSRTPYLSINNEQCSNLGLYGRPFKIIGQCNIDLSQKEVVEAVYLYSRTQDFFHLLLVTVASLSCAALA
jgi:hypothetical protein